MSYSSPHSESYLIIGEYYDFWNISQRTFVIHILVFFLYFLLLWLFMLSNNLNTLGILFSIKQVMKNIFIVIKCHLLVGWVVRRSREVIIAIYLAPLVTSGFIFCWALWFKRGIDKWRQYNKAALECMGNWSTWYVSRSWEIWIWLDLNRKGLGKI